MQQQIGNCVPIAIGQYIKNTLLRLLKAFSAKDTEAPAAVLV